MRSSQLAAGQKVVSVTGEAFVIDGPVNLDSVTVRNPPGDAIVLAAGSTGRIGYAEIHTQQQDGVKVQNAGNVCHDFTIESGLFRATAKAAGAHQDGVQVMGGRNITLRNLSIYGFDTQGIFVNTGGSGASTPTNIKILGCYVGPTGATAINIGSVNGLQVSNCHIWKTDRFGRALVGAPNDGTNVIHDADDPFPQGVPGGGTPPAPDPDPPPSTDPCAAVKLQLASTQAQLAGANADVARMTAAIAQAQAALGGAFGGGE